MPGLMPLDIPVGIDRDEARRRAVEELAKARYGGTPDWLEAVGSLDLDPTRSAGDYRSLADQHARAGDWRAAVRDRFRAVVRDLEVRTILDVRPARTAWEAAYAASRTLASALDPLHSGAETFNHVMYGEGVADAAAYARMVAVDQAVMAAVDSVDLAAVPEPVST